MGERRGNSVLKTFVALLAFLAVILLAGAAAVFVFSFKKEGPDSERKKNYEDEEVVLKETEPKGADGELLDEITILKFNSSGSGGRSREPRYGESDEYVIADSSRRLLTYSDITGFSARELNYAKNEIYARHGRKFRSVELQNFFNGKSWYTGLYEPDEFDSRYSGTLSEIERKNIDFLKEQEQNKGGYSPT